MLRPVKHSSTVNTLLNFCQLKFSILQALALGGFWARYSHLELEVNAALQRSPGRGSGLPPERLVLERSRFNDGIWAWAWHGRLLPGDASKPIGRLPPQISSLLTGCGSWVLRSLYVFADTAGFRLLGHALLPSKPRKPITARCRSVSRP